MQAIKHFSRVVIGTDHGAVDLKNIIVKHLRNNYAALKVTDVGVHTTDSIDYPDITTDLCTRIQNNEADVGILLCGSGIGVSIAANKFRGIRCALCHDAYTAKMSRAHNDANVISFGGCNTGVDIGIQMVDKFLRTEFEGGRHERRIQKITFMESIQGNK